MQSHQSQDAKKHQLKTDILKQLEKLHEKALDEITTREELLALDQSLQQYIDSCQDDPIYHRRNPLHDLSWEFKSSSYQVNGRWAHNEDEEVTSGDIFLHAIYHNVIPLVRKLQSIGLEKLSRTKSADKMLDNLSALGFVSSLNNAEIFKVLLNNGAELFHFNAAGQGVFTHDNCGLEIYVVTLRYLERQQRAGVLMLDQRAIIHLHELRRQSLNPLHGKVHLEILNGLCQHFRQMVPDSARKATLDLHPNNSAKETADNHDKCHQKLYEKTLYEDAYDSKESALRKISSYLYMLFVNPSRCVPHLQFLNAEFTRYCQESYPGDDFKPEKIDQGSFEFVEMHGLRVPVANHRYQYMKKNSRLNEFLQRLFKANGIGDEVIKWIGFVDVDIANEQVANGSLVLENVYGVASLFHGVTAHALQAAIIIYACQRGDITLSAGISLKDVISFQVTSEVKSEDDGEDDDNSLWSLLRDQQRYDIPCFTDPHRLNSVLMFMHEWFPYLSSYITDTFIKQTHKLVHAMTGKAQPTREDVLALFQSLADFESKAFFSSPYLDLAINKYKASGRFQWIRTGPTLKNASFATAIRHPYPYVENFKPQPFTQHISTLFYEILAPTNIVAEVGQAVYIEIIKRKASTSNEIILHRMYYDNQRQCWAFNLPPGTDTRQCQFKFMIGPYQPLGAESGSLGVYLNISRQQYELGTLLALENDTGNELLHLAKTRSYDAIMSRLLSQPSTREKLKKITNLIEPSTGDNLLHFGIHSGVFKLVELFMFIGVSMHHLNVKGESPFDTLLIKMSDSDEVSNDYYLMLKIVLRLVHPDSLNRINIKYVNHKNYTWLLKYAIAFKFYGLVNQLKQQTLFESIDLSLRVDILIADINGDVSPESTNILYLLNNEILRYQLCCRLLNILHHATDTLDHLYTGPLLRVTHDFLKQRVHEGKELVGAEMFLHNFAQAVLGYHDKLEVLLSILSQFKMKDMTIFKQLNTVICSALQKMLVCEMVDLLTNQAQLYHSPEWAAISAESYSAASPRLYRQGVVDEGREKIQQLMEVVCANFEYESVESFADKVGKCLGVERVGLSSAFMMN